MSSEIKINVCQLPHAEGLALPAYQSAHSAGLDLLAAVPADVPLTLAPGQYAMVPTGLTMALPVGYEAQVRPRSGLAAKHGVTVLNSPGTIDADYRGEVSVIVLNAGRDPITLRREYGRNLLMLGGFDKHVLARSTCDIEREIDRLAPLVEEGGFIPFCDHRVPPDVPLRNYWHYIHTARRVWGRGVSLPDCRTTR